MLFKDINKRFTEIVAGYMAEGWYINTATQRSSQGEVSKIDLTDGKEIIRVLIDTFTDYEAGARFYNNLEGIQIIVGKPEADDRLRPNNQNDWVTIWNNKLEIIHEERFYQVGRENRCGSKFYGTREEAIKAQMLQNARRNNRHERFGSQKTTVMPEAAKSVVLSFVKRQPRCKSVRLSDIEEVYSTLSRNHDGALVKHYFVKAKGNTYKLH